MRSWLNYLVIVALFATSFAAAAFLPFNDVSRIVAAFPAVGAVFVAVFQVFRDQLAHDREVSLQTTQNSFAIGATSHMANVAFDKHVAFSEE